MVVPPSGFAALQHNDARALVPRRSALNVGKPKLCPILADAAVREQFRHPLLGAGCEAVRQFVEIAVLSLLQLRRSVVEVVEPCRGVRPDAVPHAAVATGAGENTFPQR